MNNKLKCYISSSHKINTSKIKDILNELRVDFFDNYDFSVGDPIQYLEKGKIKEADFVIFILKNNDPNVIYEIGICEGLGKQYIIIVDKDSKESIFLSNKLHIRADLDNNYIISDTIKKFLYNNYNNSYSSKYKEKLSLIDKYPQNTINALKDILNEINIIRNSPHSNNNAYKIEIITGKIFSILKLNYVENDTDKDNGIDFALWNDNLSKIIENPIFFELKYGKFNKERLEKTENQIIKYIEISNAKAGILLYLDIENKRHNISPSLHPLIFSYDLEDFVKELIQNTFEAFLLTQRNKIAHGLK